MWILSGPFDGQETGKVNFKKDKLLKTASKYRLGRKDRELVVNHKKISHDHAQFSVANYASSSTNPRDVPSLEVTNVKSKAIAIARAEETVIVNPGATVELLDGDTISVVVGVPITAKWLRVSCYAPPSKTKTAITVEACAALGINYLTSPSPDTTHHLTPSFAPSSSLATSLLSACQFVKPEWLIEILRLGKLPSSSVSSSPSGNSLESNFVLPPVTKYRPTFSSSLSPPHKVFKIWEPNEERLNMLTGYRFIMIGEKGREVDSETREVITRGSGEYEGFVVSGGRAKWHSLLAKNRQRAVGGKKLVIIADAKAMITATGKEAWEELVNEAKNFGLGILSQDKIVKAVLDVDTAVLDNPSNTDSVPVPSQSSLLPEVIPNTHPEEESVALSNTKNTQESEHEREGSSSPPPVARKVLKKRLTSLSTSVAREPDRDPEKEAKAESPEPEVELRPRKILTRRVNRQPMITGIDDPSSILDSEPVLSQKKEEDIYASLGIAAPVPPRSSRLKRRVGTEPPTSQSGPSSITQSYDYNVGNEDGEPPLKKFKALFDATDPHRLSQTEDGIIIEAPQSITQTQASGETGANELRRSGPLLPVVHEEEESQSMAAQVPDESEDANTRGSKRKLAGTNGEDAGENAMIVDGGPPTKRRATDRNSVPRSTSRPPPSSSNTLTNGTMKPSSKVPSQPMTSKSGGAAPGKPDTDPTFLKALASTKRGKKHEDAFDREFNKLKISRPVLDKEEEIEEQRAREEKLLAEFGDDGDIRGNFMTIVEMEVPVRREKEARQNLGNVPNFKKFKQKSINKSRGKVELFVSEENDYGVGSVYWKGGAQEGSQDVPLTQPLRRGKSRPVQDDFSADDEPPVQRSTKGTRAGSVPKKPSNTKGKSTRGQSKTKPLFLDDSDDDEDEAPKINVLSDVDEEDSDGGNTRRGNGRRGTGTKKAAARRPAAVLADNDSDDGTTFKGFRKRK